jgi:carbonic anhydrase
LLRQEEFKGADMNRHRFQYGSRTVALGALAFVIVTAGAAIGAVKDHAKPGKAEPAHAEPAHAESTHAEPAHAELAATARSEPTHDIHWGYEGEGAPVHWGHLSPENVLCSVGHMQSPVDLGQANVSVNFTVAVDYKRGPLTILNNGHTIQVNFPEGSSLTSSGKRFNLLQVHFHTPSENVLNGKHYPMEAHFVHRDASGHLAVLGVFFEEGATNNELAKIVVAAPNQVGGPNVIEGFSFDANQLLPSDMRVFRFMGSLTTPPCTEGVNWHEAKAPVTASANQIAAMTKLMHYNARPIQPLYDRLVIGPD